MNKWVLINNGEDKGAITFKQDIKNNRFDYNLIDIRVIKDNSEEQNLTIYIIGENTKRYLFNSRKEAIKFLFKVYPILKELKGGLK
jgi:hypothetical protein